MTHKLFPSFDDASLREHRLIYEAETPKEPGAAEGMMKGLETGKEVVKEGKIRAKEAEKGSDTLKEDLHDAVDAHFAALEKANGEALAERLKPEDLTGLKEKLKGDELEPGEKGLIKNELHMRELEKLANAPKDEWGPIPGYGKTDGANVYMYNFFTTSKPPTLLAYSPVGLQKLDAKTGIWEFVLPEDRHPPEIVRIYQETMVGINSDKEGRVVYDKNNVLEERFLKQGGAVNYDAFTKEYASAWDTGANKEMQSRFDLRGHGMEFVKTAEINITKWGKEYFVVNKEQIDEIKRLKEKDKPENKEVAKAKTDAYKSAKTWLEGAWNSIPADAKDENVKQKDALNKMYEAPIASSETLMNQVKPLLPKLSSDIRETFIQTVIPMMQATEALEKKIHK